MTTEAEAKTKWCPLARSLSSISSNDNPLVRGPVAIAFGNRFGLSPDGREQISLCIGSACMAWRRVEHIDHTDYGYCGAFGRPE